MDMPTQQDPRNNKLYVTEIVAWFIEKGETVSIDSPKVHDFVRKYPRRIFPTTVVVSYNDANVLPYKLGPGVTKLCAIDSDLSAASEIQFKEKNKAFRKLGDRYYEIVYQKKDLIGPADLTFELWFQGQKLSKDKLIHVEWAPANAPSTSILQTPPLIQGDPYVKRERSNLKLKRLWSS